VTTQNAEFFTVFSGPPSPKAMARQGQYGSTQVVLRKSKSTPKAFGVAVQAGVG
jgi:hypothetical protein